MDNQATRRLKVLLCGYGHLALALLQGLLADEHCDIVGVFRWTARPNHGHFWDEVEAFLKTSIDNAGLQDIQCPGMNDYEFTQLLETLQPDVVLVGSWGEILKSHLVDRTDTLFVNCHPSKLPAHRGPNPYMSVILQGDSETGVTFHRLSKGIDTGNILLQHTIPILEHETGASIRERCSALAHQMMPELIQNLYQHCVLGHPLQEHAQPEEGASYYPTAPITVGSIPWHLNAMEVYRHCRALYPWSLCYSHLEKKQRIYLFSPRFIPKPEGLPTQPAGTILFIQKGTLGISLIDPDWVMEVGAFQLSYRKGILPLWLSQWLSPWILRPGKRFYTEPSNLPQ